MYAETDPDNTNNVVKIIGNPDLGLVKGMMIGIRNTKDDGIARCSEIWVNAKKVGAQKYGYAPFKFDITKYLNKNGKGNIISVKVNHSRSIDSRWYTGSGIYRNVKLIKTNKLHIPIWGTYITTPEVSKSFAKVHLKVALDNQYSTTTFACT